MLLELTPDSRAGGRGNMRGEGKVERGRKEERQRGREGERESYSDTPPPRSHLLILAKTVPPSRNLAFRYVSLCGAFPSIPTSLPNCPHCSWGTWCGYNPESSEHLCLNHSGHPTTSSPVHSSPSPTSMRQSSPFWPLWSSCFTYHIFYFKGRFLTLNVFLSPRTLL